MAEHASRPAVVHRGAFDAVVDVCPDPMWVVDAGGFLIAFNAAFEQWWREVSGTTPTLGNAIEGRPQRIVELQRRALEGRAAMTDVRLIVRGIEQTFAIHAQPAAAAGGAAFAARIATHEAPYVSETSIELALMHLFASDEPLAELAGRALEFLCATDGWDAAILWQLAGSSLRATAAWFGSDDTRHRLAEPMTDLRFPIGHGVPGRAWASREVVWISDILDETTLARGELAAAAGLHSVVAAPLIDSDRVSGVIEFFTRKVRPIDDRMKKTLTHTGKALARLIDRRRLLEQIERKGAEWMLTFDSIALPIMLITPDGRFARLNSAARALTGASFGELVGRPVLDFGSGEPWKTLTDIVTAVADSGIGCTAQIVTDNATWDVTASLLPARGGDEERVIIAMHETTEMIRLQESVRRGEQLAALGELVAGVAHEIRNPLFGLGASVDLLEQQFAGNVIVLDITEPMRTWLKRLQMLADNLLEYGKTWRVDLTQGNVRDVLQLALETCAPRARDAAVNVEHDFASADATLLMDGSRLVLVFENLIDNALQHSPRGGTVRLEARRDDGAIEVIVSDQGPGIAPADLPRIFEPFFTRRRGGSGLGLSIVQRIIDEHGGTVTAQNADSGGAIVRVRLPVYQPAD